MGKVGTTRWRPRPVYAPQRSKEAKQLLDDLLALPPDIRRGFLAALDEPDIFQLLAATQRELGTPYGLWRDDPSGFVEQVLGETVWSGQRRIFDAVPSHRRVAVPASFGVGKTHSASRLVLWHSLVHPVGTALTVTTATRMRQVNRQLWPHVRTVAARAGLPGDVDTAQWKIRNKDGVDVVVAYGFSAPEHDESAVQGIHFAKLLVIVDEAGGIGPTIGSALRGLLVGDATRMVAIGNPPTDDEGSWFEGLCGSDDVAVIRLAAEDSPNMTGEATGPCRACPREAEPHLLAEHLVDKAWMTDTVREHGEDSPYVVAKVHARFPKGGASRAIPSSYVEVGVEAVTTQAPDEPTPELIVGRDGAPYPSQPAIGAWIRLGVDVAADGGDELVVARAEGELVRLRLIQSGASNTNPTDVAGKILEEIRDAQQVAEKVQSDRPVRVKVDAIGIGWGVVGILEAWKSEGLHDAEIVRVVVSENPDRPDDRKAQWRPANKRAEMWLNGRMLLTPDASGQVALRLDVDLRCIAQLSGPTYGTNASGRQVIESKTSMRSRGLSSPDRAEAVLLSCYEPKTRRKVRVT